MDMPEHQEPGKLTAVTLGAEGAILIEGGQSAWTDANASGFFAAPGLLPAPELLAHPLAQCR